MRIVKLKGGLGNQMFQYALYRQLAEKYGAVKLDATTYKIHYAHYGYELEKAFKVKPVLASEEEVEAGESEFTFYPERQFNYDKEVFSIKGRVYYDGYWQTERYFREIEELIREDFEFRTFLERKNLKAARRIGKRNAVSLHVRRGDFVGLKGTALLQGNICTLDYYRRAVNIIGRRVSRPIFFVFSDDITWVKRHLRLKHKAIFVDWNRGEDSYKDMHLMSLCKHNIIANSTFSWWGGWLNDNKDKIVIAPARWFNDPEMNISDLIPSGWLKIKVGG